MNETVQLSLFVEPTLEELIIDIVQEPIEKYIIVSSYQLEYGKYHFLKALTKQHIYDLSVSESYKYPSVINATYQREQISCGTIQMVFGK